MTIRSSGGIAASAIDDDRAVPAAFAGATAPVERAEAASVEGD
jgi:hypothetical protein